MNRICRRCRTWLAIQLTCIAFGMLPHAGHAAGPDDARPPVAATADFYAKISARDLDGVSRYMPAEGFSEFGVGAGKTVQLTRQNFAAFFKSDTAIDLHAENLAAREYGDTAVVTGLRVGSMTPKGKPVEVQRSALTMVWVRTGGHWQVRHVHLSAIKPEAPAR